ncbi:ATP-dependent helicase [Verrucomicrobiota bacterium]
MTDFRDVLNDEQYAAATAEGGPMLVLAAAGTGKTRTLVYRVAFLAEQGVPPRRILLLTFTNRAAAEMLERARAVAGEAVGGVWGGTFHHLANRLLRRHAPEIGYERDYTILDQDDSRSLVSSCMKDRKLTGKDFPKPAVLMGLFSSAANTERPVEDFTWKLSDKFVINEKDVVRVHDDYRARKKKLGAMDFDDLLVNCLRLFRESPETTGRYREQFVHVLVDEYQDTNRIQAELVGRIADGHRNLFVVGDDFQSIYSWRGADFQNIISFPERYPDLSTYKLETNYRSVPEILAVANACIAGNPKQFQKTLRATREPYKKPAVARVRDGQEQARYVIEEIRQLRGAGYKASEIAVLYRAHFNSMELQMMLTREQMPYVITSGVRFFEQAHIKDVCSILRVLVSPTDEMAFGRLLGLLPGVGPKGIARVWSGLGGVFNAHDPAQRGQVKELLRPASRRSWAAVESVLCAHDEEDLSDDAGEVIHRFMEALYEKHVVNTYENGARRIDDIMELILYTGRFGSIEQFLSDVALLTNLDAEVENVANASEDGIRLSTVHQAKGLEWDVVIILWLTDGMFPASRALWESEGGEAEERRLFYVAVTRAKDELRMCVPEVRRNRDGTVAYCTPSRFIEEIPSELLDELRGWF